MGYIDNSEKTTSIQVLMNPHISDMMGRGI